jgi:uncharacterized protein YjiS (DUF1127 family)
MPTMIPAIRLHSPALPRVSLHEQVFRAVQVLETWTERSRQRRALRELPEHAMRDMALSQADVEGEASKPFWKA